MKKEKQKHPSKSLITIALSLVMALCLMLQTVVSPKTMEAHASTDKGLVMQGTIDTMNWSFSFGLISQKFDVIGINIFDQAGRNPLLRRMGNLLYKGDFHATGEVNNTNLINAITQTCSDGELIKSADSFFSDSESMDTVAQVAFAEQLAALVWRAPDGNDYGDQQVNDANEVMNSLAIDLNQAIQFVYPERADKIKSGGGTEPQKIVRFINELVVPMISAAKNGGTVENSYSAGKFTFTKATTGAKQYIVIKSGTNGSTVRVLYSMQKPDDTGRTSSIVLSWEDLVLNAYINIMQEDDELRVVVENLYDAEMSDFEGILVDLFANLCRYIKSSIGLWDIDDLVFNAGLRGNETMYAKGIFPTNWEQVIWALFFIAELIALVMIGIALAQAVLRKVMGTVNPVIRASMMDQVKDLILVGILLAILPLLIQIVTNLSYGLTNIFSSAMGSSNFDARIGKLSRSSGSIGGIIMQVLYLAVTITINVFYVIRSFTVAGLIIVSPIFVAFLAMGENKKKLCNAWLNEFLAAIFIQPIHALVFGLTLLVPMDASRPIITLASLYCIMPISNVIRGLFFGGAGGGILGTAKQGVSSFRNNAKAFRQGVNSAEKFGESVWNKGKGIVSMFSGGGDSKKQEKSSSERGVDGMSQGKDKASSTAKTGPGGAPIAPSTPESKREQTRNAISETGEFQSVGRDGEPSESGENGTAGMEPGYMHGTRPGEPMGYGQERSSGQQTPLTPAEQAAIEEQAKMEALQNQNQPGLGGFGVSELTSEQSEEANKLVHDSLAPIPATAEDSGPYQGVFRDEMYAPSYGPRSSLAGGEIAGENIPAKDLESKLGMKSISTKKDGGFKYTTTDTGFLGWDPMTNEAKIDQPVGGAFSKADAQSYADMARVFRDGTEAEKDVLRQAGFENVEPVMNKKGEYTGQFRVETNRNFGETMGYQVQSGGRKGEFNVSAGEETQISRAPEVRALLDPESYSREVNGEKGYTATGISLRSASPQMASNIIEQDAVSSGPIVDDQGVATGYQYTYTPQAMAQSGVTQVEKLDGGKTAMTYDAGIIGKDAEGAVVYREESTMVPRDRVNISRITQMYEQGSSADRAWLQASGVEEVSRTDDGSVRIVYNERAQESMGGQITRTETGKVQVKVSTPEVLEVRPVVSVDTKQAQVSAQQFRSQGHTKERVTIPEQKPGKAVVKLNGKRYEPEKRRPELGDGGDKPHFDGTRRK